MQRIDREKTVIRQMIEIYCRKRHHSHLELCPECTDLLAYALNRLDHCPKGNSKSTCKKCEIHCYSPANKQKIRQVMRYVGPRMLLYHPLTALRHLLSR